jgi:hypothetical protein
MGIVYSLLSSLQSIAPSDDAEATFPLVSSHSFSGWEQLHTLPVTGQGVLSDLTTPSLIIIIQFEFAERIQM